MNELDNRFDDLLERLDECNRESPNFGALLEEFRNLAADGYYRACELIGELLALEPAIRNPEEAYFWYYIAYKDQGYDTTFANKGTSDHYLGDIDDFRNEAIVSELVDDLGLAKIQELDRVAEKWIESHPPAS